ITAFGALGLWQQVFDAVGESRCGGHGVTTGEYGKASLSNKTGARRKTGPEYRVAQWATGCSGPVAGLFSLRVQNLGIQA
ncbi:MAG: hypothetical protein K2P77_06985, partial [Burkholderiaceae bacterium]|nr:hypothetical protein [Burkholderiaceae bacterium]